MVNDASLARLKAALDQALRDEQNARNELECSNLLLLDAKDRMNEAFDEKQYAYKVQEFEWLGYLSVLKRNHPKIDALSAAIEKAHQDMEKSYKKAPNSRKYQAKLDGYTQKKCRLIEKCRTAKDLYTPYEQAFKKAIKVFRSTVKEYYKLENDRKKAEANLKIAACCLRAIEQLLNTGHNKFIADGANEKDERRAIAMWAGVPYRYRDDVRIVRESDGTLNILFGGKGGSDGPGHDCIKVKTKDIVPQKSKPQLH
jgi:hypothetical protein